MSASTTIKQVVNDDYITRDEAAERLNRTIRTVDRFIQEDRLRTTKREKPPGARLETTLVLASEVAELKEKLAAGERAAAIPGATKLAAIAAIARHLNATHAPKAVPGEMEPESAGSPWLTLHDAGKRLGLPAATLERLVRRGQLAYLDTRDGGGADAWRIHVEVLDAYRGAVFQQS